MRDTVRIWRRLLGRTYDAVNTNGPVQNVEECPVNSPGNVVCRFVKGKYNSKFGGVLKIFLEAGDLLKKHLLLNNNSNILVS